VVKNGKVYLIGGGPGDPGLITQKGRDCLAQAEVIVYDRLLDEQLLALVPPEAEKIYVGKTADAHSRSQSEINRLLIEKAREGKAVVRLKGGDPFVFGRGGEEAQTLADNGIPFQIIPGITAAVAVPAYAGIPVTHRGLASSFAVITGHEDPTKNRSSINWAKLATAVDTLVFLMGVKNLPEIVALLIEYGRSPDTPVAVIKEGTRPEQETVIGRLNDITAKAEEHHFTPPAVIVVGEVVRLRESLRWFDNLPLFGQRILVTRARHQAGDLSRLLMERGAQPIELPAIDVWAIEDTTELDQAIGNLAAYHWVIFTSTNGVEAFFKQLAALKLDSRALYGQQVGAIGPATAQALALRGIMPDYVPETYSGEGILAGLKSYPVRGKRFLLPRADIADEELTRGLSGLGAEVHEIAAYRTVAEPAAIAQARQMLLAGEIQVTTFTSPSAVANLVAAFEGDPAAINSSQVACIGPKTAGSAVKAGLKVAIVAREYTMPGLVTAIEDYFARER
jgi:uroporphyrinogen III methyltransferase/synthase